jgi:hypothetical protein
MLLCGNLYSDLLSESEISENVISHPNGDVAIELFNCLPNALTSVDNSYLDCNNLSGIEFERTITATLAENRTFSPQYQFTLINYTECKLYYLEKNSSEYSTLPKQIVEEQSYDGVFVLQYSGLDADKLDANLSFYLIHSKSEELMKFSAHSTLTGRSIIKFESNNNNSPLFEFREGMPQNIITNSAQQSNSQSLPTNNILPSWLLYSGVSLLVISILVFLTKRFGR